MPPPCLEQVKNTIKVNTVPVIVCPLPRFGSKQLGYHPPLKPKNLALLHLNKIKRKKKNKSKTKQTNKQKKVHTSQ